MTPEYISNRNGKINRCYIICEYKEFGIALYTLGGWDICHLPCKSTASTYCYKCYITVPENTHNIFSSMFLLGLNINDGKNLAYYDLKNIKENKS